jgi:hypothetical protein
VRVGSTHAQVVERCQALPQLPLRQRGLGSHHGRALGAAASKLCILPLNLGQARLGGGGAHGSRGVHTASSASNYKQKKTEVLF